MERAEGQDRSPAQPGPSCAWVCTSTCSTSSPVSPLDGGRIVGAISCWLWLIGLVSLVGLLILHPNPFLLLIALIGGAETIARFRRRHATDTRPGYAKVSTAERIVIGLAYVGLIALIAVTMLTNPVICHLF